MPLPRLEVTLIPASDDPPLRSQGYQQALRKFVDSLQAKGFKVSVTIELIEAAAGGAPPTYLGDFAVLLKTGAGALVAVIVAWLHARRGRKVRLKTPEFDVSAQTVDEVKELVKLATRKSGKKLGAQRKSGARRQKKPTAIPAKRTK